MGKKPNPKHRGMNLNISERKPTEGHTYHSKPKRFTRCIDFLYRRIVVTTLSSSNSSITQVYVVSSREKVCEMKEGLAWLKLLKMIPFLL